jgi:hypothetical protein
MPLVDNLDNITFASKYPIDKIVQEGEITIVNNGDTSAQTGTYQTAKIVEDTVANNYGRAGLIRARWSIDGGTNWQSLDSNLLYTFTLTSFGVTLSGLDSAISIACNDTTITFRTANGRHGNVGGSPPSTYTPTSRTFLIEYALYERD